MTSGGDTTTIVLRETRDQRGRTIPAEWLFRDETGHWFHEGIACHGSEWHGLGNCRCVTHDATYSDLVSPERAQQLRGEVAV